MGRLEQIATHTRQEAAEARAASDQHAPEERMREVRHQAERVAKARAAASRAAYDLLGRVLFPQRWDWEEDGQGWITCRAVFEGRLRLTYSWHAHTNTINSWQIAPAKCPPGFERCPSLQSPTRQKLGVALIQWGLA